MTVRVPGPDLNFTLILLQAILLLDPKARSKTQRSAPPALTAIGQLARQPPVHAATALGDP